MNAQDILSYGHRDVLRAFEGLSVQEWNTVGVTTRWSPKDLLAHLASFELYLEDALKSVLGISPTPTLEAMGKSPATFNDDQVEPRRSQTVDDTRKEYESAHERVMELLKQFTPEKLREAGTIPWYGSEYSIDDFIVYTNYAHKREHCAEIKQFRKRLERSALTKLRRDPSLRSG